MANQSPIHRPLDDADPPASLPPAAPPPPPASLIARRAALDQRPLHHRPFSLGPGGASSLFSRAVERALVEEMAGQLRGQVISEGTEIGKWAADIIAAFKE